MAFLSNDEFDHRIVLFEIPGLAPDPDKRRHTGLEHVAFESGTLDGLLGTYTPGSKTWASCPFGQPITAWERPSITIHLGVSTRPEFVCQVRYMVSVLRSARWRSGAIMNSPELGKV
jgi:hypothetical protein